MSRRRLRRKTVKTRRQAQPLEARDSWELLSEIGRPHAPGTAHEAKPTTPPRAGAEGRSAVRQAATVERLAYTRTQAAEALGVSRSTFIRRVLPLIETIDMPWGTRLIPVDELERVLDERRRQPAAERQPVLRPGRKEAVRAEIVARIRDERLSGTHLPRYCSPAQRGRRSDSAGRARVVAVDGSSHLRALMSAALRPGSVAPRLTTSNPAIRFD